MNLEWYLTQLVFRSLDVLPWLLGGLVGLGVVSFSPLGRGLLRHLQRRQDEAAINEQLLGELEELRKVLGEVAERLDYTERRLAQDQPALPRPTAGTGKVLPAAGQPVTPH